MQIKIVKLCDTKSSRISYLMVTREDGVPGVVFDSILDGIIFPRRWFRLPDAIKFKRALSHKLKNEVKK